MYKSNELEILYEDEFWFYLQGDEIMEIPTFPLRAKLFRKFYDEIIKYWETKKIDKSLKLLFHQDSEDYWELTIINDDD